MSDSVESGSEKVNSEILSKLANDDYLLSKIVSMRKHRKLTKDDINYIIRNAGPKTIAADTTEVDNIIKTAISYGIQNCEDILSRQTSQTEEEKEEELDFTQKVLNAYLTIDNFEDVFGLKGLKAVELPSSADEGFRSIRYKDIEGTTLAIAQINTDSNKLRLQTFGAVLPKQEFSSPKQVNYRVMSKSKVNNWTTEYGGVNQFDGSIEIRYKDVDGNVMAAVIFKSDGNVDTVVEYEYKNGKKLQMMHTSQFGHSKTIYDDVTDSTKLIIDIDTDGNICSITRGFSE